MTTKSTSKLRLQQFVPVEGESVFEVLDESEDIVLDVARRGEGFVVALHPTRTRRDLDLEEICRLLGEAKRRLIREE